MGVGGYFLRDGILWRFAWIDLAYSYMGNLSGVCGDSGVDEKHNERWMGDGKFDYRYDHFNCNSHKYFSSYAFNNTNTNVN